MLSILYILYRALQLEYGKDVGKRPYLILKNLSTEFLDRFVTSTSYFRQKSGQYSIQFNLRVMSENACDYGRELRGSSVYLGMNHF